MSVDFEDAVEEARSFIERVHVKGALQSEEGERSWEAAGAALRLQENPDALIAEAENSSQAFHDLKKAIAFLLRIEEVVPPQAVKWNSELLNNRIKPPRNVRGNKQVRRPKTRNKHDVIARAVEILVEMDLNPYRSHAREKGQSACDAVATALYRLKLKPKSYRSVEKIYMRKQASKHVGD